MSSSRSETRYICCSSVFPSLPFTIYSSQIVKSPSRGGGIGNANTQAYTRGKSRQSVDKRTIVENYDLLSLAIDEIVDDGVILETDPTIIMQRVSRAPAQDVAQLKNIDLSEQGMNNLAQFGKAKLGDWLRQGL